MAEKARLVVVDDEPDLRSMLSEYLGRYGFTVLTASGGKELDVCLAEGAPDLLILDVNMPDEDGFAIARRVRAQCNVPIMMLTAAGDVVDRVVGLELGADEYIVKPFDLRELRARIQALLRRVRPAAAAPEIPGTASRIRFGPLLLDLEARRLLQPDGTELEITAMEFDLLAAFAANPNRVLSRDRLLDLAHNRDGEPFDRSIDIRIARIRRKVEPDPGKPQLIKTVRGAGYIFVPTKP
jgi:DNA-binding response OmpR family regulator